MSQNTEGSDGIEDVIEGQLRVLVSAAAMAGEQLARRREIDLRRTEADSLQETREMSTRLEAERRAMHAELATVTRNDWWEFATPNRSPTPTSSPRAGPVMTTSPSGPSSASATSYRPATA